MPVFMDLKSICISLRTAQRALEAKSGAQKNEALRSVISEIDLERGNILAANEQDVKAARKAGMSEALVERLLLDENRIDDIIAGIRTVIELPDPIGEEMAGWRTQTGLQIRQVRVPIGVAAIIYESRPNVTTDSFCLAYKSANALLLRGSSSACNSNKMLVSCIKTGLRKSKDGVPDAVVLMEGNDRSNVEQILNATGGIDVVLPRGGAGLIKAVAEKSKVPVIQTGSGVCHLYVDKDADIEMAVNIAENAKIQRPGACNAIETILVHKNVANDFLMLLEERFSGRVRLLADDICYPILKTAADLNGRSCVAKANKDDFGHEFLDFVCALKAVDSVEEAVSFINAHGTKHSECIVTDNLIAARLFQARVDAACVYVNASTRFTDGAQFGFGSELGISTQKLHARGPMGIKALTTTKFLIDGDGQIR